ncbi:MAG TPA: preprotein translocase subunit YajC [Sulfurimonas sp.]|nr:preprotein translocase subunit YajC [Sulfurimonas sp.]
MESMIMMVGLFAIMYFIIIRPQQQEAKKHKAMLTALDKGDKIVTNGGLIVDIVKVEDAFYTVKLDKDTQVRLDKNAVARKFEDEA